MDIVNILISLANLIVLSITLYFLVRYTRATEEMVKYQITPAIDINMVYNHNEKGTYFWFSNESNLPAWVCLDYKRNEEQRKQAYKPLFVPAKRKMATAPRIFNFVPVQCDKLILYILIKPALEDATTEFKFEKSYKFKNNRWEESSWDFYDMPFPYQNLKKCPECGSDIPIEAKKCRYCQYVIIEDK